jgi:hypothetical protein
MAAGKEVLNKHTLKTSVIHIVSWGDDVLVRELTGKEAVSINQGALEIQRDVQAGKPNAQRMLRWQAETVAAGWINEDGTNVLEAADIETLITQTGQSTIELLAREIRILTGIQRVDENGKDSPVDDAKKN